MVKLDLQARLTCDFDGCQASTPVQLVLLGRDADMVKLDLQARLTCDFDGCQASTPVQLVLLMAGSFGVVHPHGGWQVAVVKQNPFGPMMGRCPEHQTHGGKIEVIGGVNGIAPH